MFPDFRRSNPRLYSPSRMTVLLLSSLIAISALTAMGLTRYAAAEPITSPAGDATAATFEFACNQTGGQLIEITNDSGAVLSSSCTYSNGSVYECNWVAQTCTDDLSPGQPTPSSPLGNNAIDPNDVGGVFVDDTPTSTPSGPVLSNETPTLTPATTAEPTAPMPNAKVFVIKYVCPDGVGDDVEGGFFAYFDICAQTREGVSFKLDAASTGNPREQLTDIYGQLSWSELEADYYFLTEEVPSGYGTPITFCVYTDDPAGPRVNDVFRRLPVSEQNRVEFDLVEGQAITCAWFNLALSPNSDSGAATPVGGSGPESTRSAAAPSPTMPAATVAPDEAATLVIHAYRCEPGYDDRAEAADPAADCVERPDDITFGLVGTGDSSGEPRRRVKFNGQPGEFVITDLAPGDYRLIEVEFEPDQTAFVLGCMSNQRAFDGYPFDPFAVVSAAGSVRLSLVVGETLACDWYDVPPPNPALSLQVYACGTARPSEENCEPASGQFQFVLAPVDVAGEAIGFTTDADGSVELTNAEGSFQLLEIGPQPCGMTATGTGADGNLALDAEQEVVVQIFHCG